MNTPYALEPESAAAEELLYQSARTRVCRLQREAGRWLVRKQLLGEHAYRRQRHERRILQRLAGIEGVPQEAAEAAPGYALLLELPQGLADATPLHGLRLEAGALVDLALQLARIVAQVHRRGVVHADINPANVLRSGTSGQVQLIDFDLATTFAEERPGFVAPNQIAGTLPYLAPEQTGRTGRAVDSRADLYGLGATLYELATGRQPFLDADPLQLIHEVLARVPEAPARLDAQLPRLLSDIVMRLLEKEPDRRYQSAEGLAHDLARLRDALASSVPAAFALGERDFRLRLSAPSQLVGRRSELAALRAAFDTAMQHRARVMLVSGGPGVGKTALLNELRPMATAARGWFVSGKFDQHRQDLETDAVRQALDALCRLILAEPDAELALLRPRLLEALGPNAGLAAAVQPILAQLLGVAPEEIAADSAVEERLCQAGLQLLRCVASPQRPVVLFVDDLQWAAPTPLSLLDAVLMDETLRGVFVVGAYRDAEVGPAHPLTAMMARWQRLGAAPATLRLENLPPADLQALVAEILRLPRADAAAIAQAIGSRTSGNPYDTVELLNALRHEGILVASANGWQWDAGAIRRHVGQGDVIDLLAARIGRLPASARTLLHLVACLGGEVAEPLLAAASGMSEGVLEVALRPALEDGLLVRGTAESGLRFRHDRVQQAAYASMHSEQRQSTHLALARRLAALEPYAPVAADQYLSAIDALQEPQECRAVAALFQIGAAHAALVAHHALVERYLDAALRLLQKLPDTDAAQFAVLRRGRHAALYNQGRLDQADAVYAQIECDSAAQPDVEAACVQISSLTNRGRIEQALALGVQLLRALGLQVPARDALPAAIDRGLDRLDDWAARQEQTAEPAAPMQHRGMQAAARIINRMMPAAFFGDQAMMAWLVVEAQRLWSGQGADAALIFPLGHAPFVTTALRDDYRTGYRVMRAALEYGSAHGHEAETAQARFLFALGAAHWFGPLEDALQEARRAHEDLLRGGNLQVACFCYYITVPLTLHCSPALEDCLAEAQAGLAFAARTGNGQAGAAFAAWAQLVKALRGETQAPGSFSDPTFDERQHLAALQHNPTAAANFHVARALGAALFDDAAALAHHAAAAMPLLPYVQATICTADAHLLQALACAGAARTGAAAARTDALAELQRCAQWLRRRAAEAPMNFLHLWHLLDAEQAWLAGDATAAGRAFDAALGQAATRPCGWHRALVAQRAAAFHAEQGLAYRSRQLLADACREYREWGALARVRELESRYAFLRASGPLQRHRGPLSAPGSAASWSGSMRDGSVSVDSIDMLAVLRASQALSSETSVARLSMRLNQVLCAMAGATRVQLVLRRDDGPGWRLAGAEDAGGTLSFEQPDAAARLPLSALRYVERTGTPLLVEDARRDDRFAADPYVAALERCSLLVAPVLHHGAVRALLVLENRLASGAFSAQGLDAVQLIAGQLAVSLENALLYASLERKVAERTQALESANRRLETLSITDPLTGLANRRRFTETLEREWQRALRSGGSLAVAMADVDHFKRYNDHYGHPAGDVCLQRVAAALSGGIREGVDLAARYGGEEFALVLPGAPAETARSLAQRACDAVAALQLPHAAAESGIVSVSVGLAVLLPTAAGTVQQLVDAADAALYAAKRAGRGRIAVSGEAPAA